MDRNNSVVFNVTVMGGGLDDEFAYQWQRNGSDILEISGKFEGVNTAELTVLDAQKEDEGSYWCVVTSGAGNIVTSNEAFLTVGKSQ